MTKKPKTDKTVNNNDSVTKSSSRRKVLWKVFILFVCLVALWVNRRYQQAALLHELRSKEVYVDIKISYPFRRQLRNKDWWLRRSKEEWLFGEIRDIRFKPHHTDDDLKTLRGRTSFRTLEFMDCNNITDDGIAHLSRLYNLQQLNLSGCNNITNDGLQHIENLYSLRYLNLHASHNITDDGIKHIERLDRLQYLDLSGCKKITEMG